MNFTRIPIGYSPVRNIMYHYRTSTYSTPSSNCYSWNYHSTSTYPCTFSNMNIPTKCSMRGNMNKIFNKAFVVNRCS